MSVQLGLLPSSCLPPNVPIGPLRAMGLCFPQTLWLHLTFPFLESFPLHEPTITHSIQGVNFMEATSKPLVIQEGESGIHKDRRAEAGNRHRRDCKSQGQTPAPFPLPLQPLAVITVDTVSGQHLTPFHLAPTQ